MAASDDFQGPFLEFQDHGRGDLGPVEFQIQPHGQGTFHLPPFTPGEGGGLLQVGDLGPDVGVQTRQVFFRVRVRDIERNRQPELVFDPDQGPEKPDVAALLDALVHGAEAVVGGKGFHQPCERTDTGREEIPGQQRRQT